DDFLRQTRGIFSQNQQSGLTINSDFGNSSDSGSDNRHLGEQHPSQPRPRPGWRSSSSSRVGTTPRGVIRVLAESRPSSSSNVIQCNTSACDPSAKPSTETGQLQWRVCDKSLPSDPCALLGSRVLLQSQDFVGQNRMPARAWQS